MGLEIIGYINKLRSDCIRQDMEGTKERVLIGSKFQLRQLSRYKFFYSKKKCNKMLQKEEGNTLNFDHSIFAMKLIYRDVQSAIKYITQKSRRNGRLER